MQRRAQWARVYRLGSPYQVEIVHARYIEHRFARHAHEHFVVGLVEEGVQQYTYRGRLHKTMAGEIFFVDSGEPHTGEPATNGGYLYRTLCLDPEIFRQLALQVTGQKDPLHFRGAVVADRQLFRLLLRLHSAVANAASKMGQESSLLPVIEHLTVTHIENCRQILSIGKEDFIVKQAREYIEEHYSEDVSLAELGTLTSRSPFHLARAFSKALGLPPHAYLESVRIQHARELLRSGMTVVDTALSVGYSDQSHFTHRFRRHTGITPGQYKSATE